MTITLQSITKKAQDIQHFLENGFDIDKAGQEAESLHQDGIKLIKAEIKGEFLLDEIASPVVAVLNRITGLDTIQTSFFPSQPK